jgi:hypothetical protein
MEIELLVNAELTLANFPRKLRAWQRNLPRPQPSP